jgi:hypothetical protein
MAFKKIQDRHRQRTTVAKSDLGKLGWREGSGVCFIALERRSPRDYLRLSSMPRTANLRPGYRKARADKRLAAWVVNVPSELSSTGHRQELFFPTKGEAQAECEKLKTRKDNFGISLSAMTPGRIAEASEAYKLLDPLNVSLLEACATMLPDISNETIACPLSICSIFF